MANLIQAIDNLPDPVDILLNAHGYYRPQGGAEFGLVMDLSTVYTQLLGAERRLLALYEQGACEAMRIFPEIGDNQEQLVDLCRTLASMNDAVKLRRLERRCEKLQGKANAIQAELERLQTLRPSEDNPEQMQAESETEV